MLSRVFFGGGGTALTTTLAAFAIAYLLRALPENRFGLEGILQRAKLLEEIAVSEPERVKALGSLWSCRWY